MARPLAALLALSIPAVAACGGDSTGPERLFGFGALVGDWHADEYDITDLDSGVTFGFGGSVDATILSDSSFTVETTFATVTGRILTVDDATLVATGSLDGGPADTLTATYARQGSALELWLRGVSLQMDQDPELEPAQFHARFVRVP